ncbi:LysR family transcriptional regulator [Frigidibacter sp. MR17.14]|uniref:LysR family transcriptional regulator n=1 Tax=Frigidibacter sp. MR17.14 TaxID=3126509 RepID=UPI003012C3A0
MSVTLPSTAQLLGRLRLRQLSLAVALQDLGSLRKAAERLGVSQPAATKMLTEMEQSLGLPLFERNRRGLTPTIYGEVLIRQAHLLLSGFGDLREALAALASGAEGRLAIGSITAAAAGPLALAVARMKEAHPRAEISITIDTSDMLMPQLEQGRLDVVIGRRVGARLARLTDFAELSPEGLSIVAGAHNPVAAEGRLTLRDLARRAWIMQPMSSPLRQVVEATFRAERIPAPESIVETGSMLMATTLLQNSQMLAVMPHMVAAHYVASGILQILPVELAGGLEPYGLVTLRGRAASPLLNELRSLLFAHAGTG